MSEVNDVSCVGAMKSRVFKVFCVCALLTIYYQDNEDIFVENEGRSNQRWTRLDFYHRSDQGNSKNKQQIGNHTSSVMEDVNSPKLIKIERKLYEQEQIYKDGNYMKPEKKNAKEMFSSCDDCKPSSVLGSILPVTSWIKEYRWKKDLMSDLISGFTVAVMQIPQGMAYALLANVPPIIGIYMAFFPVLVYFFLGTSRHNSMGTFAVVCLMTGKVVLKYSHPVYFSDVTTHPNNVSSVEGLSPIQVGTAVTFLVGAIQCSLYVLRLGVVSILLSESLVSGFVTGSAVHVLMSQLKDIFGLKLTPISGTFSIIFNLKNIVENIQLTNYASLIISTISISVLVVNNEFLKPKVAKKCNFPIPIELILIIIGTLVSRYFFLPEIYSVRTVGNIPQGLPEPAIPLFSLFSGIIVDAILISIVSYALSLSMALIFAQKFNYEIGVNQELLAMGVGNIFGSFFSCLPYCASISRSLIQQTVGGKSQIASIVSCSLLLLVLMLIGPFFEPLPKAVLASIIIVALKGMLMNVKDFFRFFKLSKLDAAVWLITFLSTVLIAVDIGMMIGFFQSLFIVLVMGLKPYVCLMGILPGTDIYLDTSRYKSAQEINGLKIFHYRGNINFASRSIFKSKLYETIKFNPQKELTLRREIEKYKSLVVNDVIGSKNVRKLNKLRNESITNIKCVIIDLSAVNYVDPSGINTIKQMVEDFKKVEVAVYIAGCSGPILEMMRNCEFVEDAIKIFPTLHDAVQFAIDYFNFDRNVNSIARIRI